MKKMKVGVLMGGVSSEREISLITGKAILENLDKTKYLPVALEIGKDNKFYEIKKGKKKSALNLYDLKKKIDLVFIALHGGAGENGGVQAIFDSLNIKYTGSKVLASALAMNKVYSAQIYLANGLPFPQFINFKRNGWQKYRADILSDVKKTVRYPCVIKPVDQGSAVGVSIVKNEKELILEINKTIKKFPWLMVQKFVKGQEATCGVLEKNGQILPLPPTHILPNLGKFYDYKSKYAKGGSNHICPADFPHEINHELQDLAIKSHIALGCSGMSRTDIFYSDDKELYLIETNTIPGMTPTSLLPEAAKVIGISFSQMLDLIIKAA